MTSVLPLCQVYRETNKGIAFIPRLVEDVFNFHPPLGPHTIKVLILRLDEVWESLQQWFPNFLAPETGFMEDKFSKGWEGECWFQDDSSALHLLCILLLFHQLYLRPSGIRSQSLRTLALEGPKGSLRAWNGMQRGLLPGKTVLLS